MSAVIRHARPGEEAGLLDLYEWLFAPPGRRPPAWDRENAGARLAAAITGEHAAVLVAEEDGAAIGICTAYIDLESVRFGRRCWVEDLAVDPEHRSLGIGGRLLDAASGWARVRGATHIELDTGLDRADAQRFYQRRDPASVGYSYSWVL